MIEAADDYNIFRWYRSTWERYTQADRGGALSKANLYTYVDGNPVRWLDPNGLYRVEPPNGPRSEEINRAIFDLYRRLSARRPCCGAETAQRLMNFLSLPNLVFEYDSSLATCAQVPTESIDPNLGPDSERRIIIGAGMWTPRCQCPLASVILHEMAHAAFLDAGETGPDAIQRQCYGCDQPRERQ